VESASLTSYAVGARRVEDEDESDGAEEDEGEIEDV
jgi:hypothetical protein